MSKVRVFNIEHDVQIPTARAGRGYPLFQLELGDSFAFPADERSAVQNAVAYLKKKHGRTFKVRKTSDTECRVWRVK